jgi:hypothetical protein
VTKPLAEALRALAAAVAEVAAAVEAGPPTARDDGDERLDARAAARFGVSVRQLRRAVKSGALPAERAGRRLMVLRRDLVAFAESRRVKVAPRDVQPVPAVSTVPGTDAFRKLLDSGRLRSIPGGKGCARK